MAAPALTCLTALLGPFVTSVWPCFLRPALYTFLDIFSLWWSIFFLVGGWGAPAACGRSQARGLIGATAAAMRDPSCICDLHRSSWQRRILNPLSKATFVWMLVVFVSR